MGVGAPLAYMRRSLTEYVSFQLLLRFYLPIYLTVTKE